MSTAVRKSLCNRRTFPNMQADERDGAQDAQPADTSGDAAESEAGNAGAKRRSRPPLNYTNDFETPSSVSLKVIGVVRSPYKVS